MSTFECPVIKVELHPHDNADSLSIVYPFGVGGYQVVVRTDEWKDDDLGVYIPPESVVPDNQLFAFLEGKTRIKARRFRGQWSFGLLIRYDPSYGPSESVAEKLGIVHYEPPVKHQHVNQSSDFAPGPMYKGPRYDIENARRYVGVFTEGEPVIVTEKIHGSQIRMTYQTDKRGKNPSFHVASRNFYRKEYWATSPKTIRAYLSYIWKKITFRKPDVTWNPSFYWNAFKAHPKLMEIVRNNSPLIFYGEVYGNVQNGFPYDSTDDMQYKIRIFDIYDPKTLQYLNVRAIASSVNGIDGIIYAYGDLDVYIPADLHVPVEGYNVEYNQESLEKMCQASSTLTSSHIREGIVVKPLHERRDPVLGRVILKVVSPVYLEKN